MQAKKQIHVKVQASQSKLEALKQSLRSNLYTTCIYILYYNKYICQQKMIKIRKFIAFFHNF